MLAWTISMFKIICAFYTIHKAKKYGYYRATKKGSYASKNSTIRSLAKYYATRDNAHVFKKCSICMIHFESEDAVTVVKCGLAHYFHSGCF